jgi:serine/threonine protein kinase
MSHVGRQIGRYQILEELGSGGMSVVYKGLDTALDREVAVKVLHPHLAGKDESRKRLAREAKAVAKLHHPNILEVFDFAGAEASEAYIVTEYIRGKTLRQYAADQHFEPPEIAAMVIHELAAALAHAHEAGIIHRDLKPENVMVRQDGVLKLMDFGIAKIIDRDDRMTMTGALVGSPAHMAPEIIEGEEAGPEADVFSLGTMLYTFATGRLPFNAPNTTATLKKILDGIYDDPRQLTPTVSDDLAEIIATCLARQPSARYPHAGKLKDALADYLSALSVTHVAEELSWFFGDPASYRKQVTPRLVKALIERGERFLADRRPAKALSSLNQVLALDHDNPRALELLKQMNVARARQRRNAAGIRAAVALGVLVCAGGVGAHFYREATRPPDYVPGGTSLTEVVVPAAMFPVPSPPKVVATLVDPRPNVAPPPTSLKPAVGRKAPEGNKRVGAAPLEPPKPDGLVTVLIQVRPFGSVDVDGKAADAKSDDENHTVRLSPGLHRFTTHCSGCDDYTETQVVEPSGGQLHIISKPRPAQLEFTSSPASPADAIVKVQGEQRAASSTHAHPFVLNGGAPVNYEVSLPGYKTVTGRTERLHPGQHEVVELPPLKPE